MNTESTQNGKRPLGSRSWIALKPETTKSHESTRNKNLKLEKWKLELRLEVSRGVSRLCLGRVPNWSEPQKSLKTQGLSAINRKCPANFRKISFLWRIVAQITSFVAQMKYKRRRSDAQTVLSQICLRRRSGRRRETIGPLPVLCSDQVKEAAETIIRLFGCQRAEKERNTVVPLSDMIISQLSSPVSG